jgi:DNA repair exonuclease SbcCD ATPase subunit
LNDDILRIKKEQSELNHKFEEACTAKEEDIIKLKTIIKEKDEEIIKLSDKINDNLQSVESTEVKICQQNIKISQYEEEKMDFSIQRKKYEKELSELNSEKEKAEHNLLRIQRKLEFTEDEMDQLRGQNSKERKKFDDIQKDNMILQDSVSSLKLQIDGLNGCLLEANEKANKSTGRIKEKIKTYHRNINTAHGQEVTELQDTIRDLKIKLKDQEIQMKMNLNHSIQSMMPPPPPPAPIVIQHGLSSNEKRKIKDLENKIKEMTSKANTDSVVLDQMDTKIKTLEAEKMVLHEKFSDVSSSKSKSLSPLVQQIRTSSPEKPEKNRKEIINYY